MNLGQAVAVCLYEIIRSPAAAKTAPDAKPLAAAAHLDRITELLETILDHSGYVHARVQGSTQMKIRHLVRRLQLNPHDAEVWLGMLRQILWKLGNISDSPPDSSGCSISWRANVTARSSIRRRGSCGSRNLNAWPGCSPRFRPVVQPTRMWLFFSHGIPATRWATNSFA